jgi:hypothetical protein
VKLASVRHAASPIMLRHTGLAIVGMNYSQAAQPDVIPLSLDKIHDVMSGILFHDTCNARCR